MTKSRKNRIARRLREYECTQLAAKLTVRQRMKPEAELRGSLNGFHLSNLHRRVVARLIRRDLEGRGFGAVRRAVDVAFKAAELDIDPGERDKLAHVLNEGKLRRR